MCDLFGLRYAVETTLCSYLITLSARQPSSSKLGIHESRRYRTDEYSVRRKRHGERLTQRSKSGFACTVGRFNGFAAIGPSGCDIHYAPTATFEHVLDGAVAHVCRRDEISR